MTNNKRLGNDPFADKPGGLDALLSPTTVAEPQTPPVRPAAAPSPVSASESDQIRRKPGRKAGPVREITTTSQKGLPDGWTRATYIVRESYIETLKHKAYIDRRPLKDVVDEALTDYLNKHSKEVK